MKTVSTLAGIAVLLLGAMLWYEHLRTSELAVALDALAKDCAGTQAELKKLHALVVELGRRPAPAPVDAAAQRGASAGVASGGATPAQPIVPAGVIAKAPAGWWANGTNTKAYVAGVDTQQTWGGMPSAYVQSTTATEKDFGGMMQTIAADNYAGKRVRLSGWIKTEDANDGGGHLWLRVDGQERGQVLQFDNMDNRPVKGTNDWQEASVVLDVPAGASALAYGFFVKGGGRMWVNGQKIEEVGQDVPSTNMIKSNEKPALPKTPTNLGFYPDPKK